MNDSSATPTSWVPRKRKAGWSESLPCCIDDSAVTQRQKRCSRQGVGPQVGRPTWGLDSAAHRYKSPASAHDYARPPQPITVARQSPANLTSSAQAPRYERKSFRTPIYAANGCAASRYWYAIAFATWWMWLRSCATHADSNCRAVTAPNAGCMKNLSYWDWARNFAGCRASSGSPPPWESNGSDAPDSRRRAEFTAEGDCAGFSAIWQITSPGRFVPGLKVWFRLEAGHRVSMAGAD